MNLPAPPMHYDESAETTLLGALLIVPKRIPDILPLLEPEDFFHPLHSRIYKSIQELDAKGTPIDSITVSNYLKRDGDDVHADVHALVSAVPGTTNLVAWADIIRGHSLSRQLLLVADEVRRLDAGQKTNPAEILSFIQDALSKLEHKSVPDEPLSLAVSLEQHWQQLEELSNSGRRTAGAPTQFLALDNILSGLRPSNLIIMAGRPGMGKTALALGIASNMVQEFEAKPVLMFSYEMANRELTQRLVSMNTKLPGEKFQTANFTEDEWATARMAHDRLTRAPLYIDDSNNNTVQDIRAKARRLQRQKGLGAIIIDYLQLIPAVRYSDSREREVAEVSKRLKAIAKELDVPVVALAQLNRSCESRPDKRPMLSDLRESGAVEQDADAVIVLYRDEYYNKDSQDMGLIEVIVRKNRHGANGTCKLSFRPDCGLFRNLLTNTAAQGA